MTWPGFNSTPVVLKKNALTTQPMGYQLTEDTIMLQPSIYCFVFILVVGLMVTDLLHFTPSVLYFDVNQLFNVFDFYCPEHALFYLSPRLFTGCYQSKPGDLSYLS